MTLIKSISGIRGTIGGRTGDTLNPLDIVKFTTAYATFIKREKLKMNSEKFAAAIPSSDRTAEANSSLFTNHFSLKIIVGRDGRLSGEMGHRHRLRHHTDDRARRAYGPG